MVTRQACLRLLALALLLPATTTAETPWNCALQANAEWVCQSKAPAPRPPPVDTDSGLETTPGTGETAAEPVTAKTGEADSNSVLPDDGKTGEAGQATVPAEELPEEPAAERQDTDGGQGSPAVPPDRVEPGGASATEPSRTEAAVPAAAQPAAAVAMPAAAGEPDYDRWALCPPVIRPAPMPEDIDADSIHLQADSAQASSGNVYTLEGNAVVQYGEQRLEAESVVYRQDSGEIEALDGIRFTGPDLYVSGESATLDAELREGELHDISYSLYKQHGRGEAEVLHLDGVTEQRLDRAYYTTCAPGNENWVLSAREVNLNQADGTGTARHAKLTFKGVPILYTPYAFFPIDDRRKSGLLFPKVGQTDETGFDASIPVYWNIAPNRDMTITPRYMSDRGAMLGTEFRYLNAHNKGMISGEYLPSDKMRNNDYRSLVTIKHNGNPWPRLHTSIIASNVSDENYFEDLGTSLVQTSQTNLQRTAAMNYYGDWWRLGMRVQDFQTIDATVTSAERPYKQLPQIVFSATPDRRLLGMKLETGAEVNHFIHSDNSVVEGSRLDVQPRLSLPVYHAAWYVDPAVSLRHTAYHLKHTAADADDTPTRTTPIASLDAGTFFERNSSWGDSSYVQTLEPRMYYLYVPDKNQDDLPVFDTGKYDFNYWTLFRENRFSGPDRMGDANQLALALTSRILNPSSGRQIISTSLGSLLYFSNRNVTLPGDPVETDSSSDLIGEVTLALARHWNADTEIHWDPHAHETRRNDYRLQYRRGPRQLVNLSYRQQRDLLEQTDFSFLWPLSPAWHLVGRWYYSLKASETIEGLAGIGYESCCWAVQLLARSYVHNTEDERNNSVFMQLELKGLGKLGTSVDDALERGILGYNADH